MLSVNKNERFVCRPFVVCQIEWQTLDKKLYLTKTFDISILRHTYRNCFFPLTCPTVNKKCKVISKLFFFQDIVYNVHLVSLDEKIVQDQNQIGVKCSKMKYQFSIAFQKGEMYFEKATHTQITISFLNCVFLIFSNPLLPFDIELLLFIYLFFELLINQTGVKRKLNSYKEN